VLKVSALTGEGLSELRSLLVDRISVLLGQSGVGKSSLVNALIPGSGIKVGGINEKYDRGNHTTSMSRVLELPEIAGADASSNGTSRAISHGRARIIDTPGIRRFVPDGVAAEDLILHLREFSPLAGKCSFGLSCSHRSEPGCKIMEAVAAGVIHEDRYESFLRIREELPGSRESSNSGETSLSKKTRKYGDD
jgi:ribosome biogenesis GTPase